MGDFQFGVMTNEAAIIYVLGFVGREVSFNLGKHLGIELAGHMGIFNFIRNCPHPAMPENSSCSAAFPALGIAHNLSS